MVKRTTRLPAGFRRCPRCELVRRKEQFRTPHANFGGCIFCWCEKWAWNDITSQAFGLEPSAPAPRSIRELGYHDECEDLRICIRCTGLYDPEKRVAIGRPCRCSGRPQHETDLPRIGFCACCATHLVLESSRWSSLYCASCKARVTEFNQWCASTVIPVGRHSMMSSEGLAAGRPDDRESIDDFADRFHDMISALGNALDTLAEHTAAELSLRLERMGFAGPADVLLLDYLRRSAQVEPVTSSVTGFDRLSARFIAALLS